MSDNKLVYIKRVGTNDGESRIMAMLNASPLDGDPRNHTVPILDTFQDDEDSSISYIVMPFLRLTHNPPFTNVGEIVDFADQFLEGLAFMHEHCVAHRDCSEKNLMMDATAMYPLGFHPVKHTFLPDCNTPARSSIIPRSVAGVRYYFVDFGISSFIPPDAPSKLVLGLDGRDQDVPELSDEDPYDPFKVDIFTIGNVFRRLFYDDFSNMEFLAPLIESMTREDPAQRPTAAEALRQWTAIRKRISIFSLLWRLKRRNEGRIASVVADAKDLPHVSRQWLNWLIGRR
ncbi:hypothetical protein EWM64_g8404 [Hericium alpestre]|uniref:Protein kinase domain-containing protein n=1 Tax=Hericium alpestre TaxID=135208 RepID=A0A4Y9ZNI3_9AGAM|nr:hypothetical protein EWM64_g8404 [Hericium alpestre]